MSLNQLLKHALAHTHTHKLLHPPVDIVIAAYTTEIFLEVSEWGAFAVIVSVDAVENLVYFIFALSICYEEAIDDKERVLTSLKYTRLLNDLVDDGYLVLEYQGGRNPIILDVEYDADRDTRSAAPFGDTSALHTLVAQVCDREGITRDLLEEVDNPYDFNEVKTKVNEVVGRTVLQPYSDPSKYRFTQEAYAVVFEKVEDAKPGGRWLKRLGLKDD